MAGIAKIGILTKVERRKPSRMALRPVHEREISAETAQHVIRSSIRRFERCDRKSAALVELALKTDSTEKKKAVIDNAIPLFGEMSDKKSITRLWVTLLKEAYAIKYREAEVKINNAATKALGSETYTWHFMIDTLYFPTEEEIRNAFLDIIKRDQSEAVKKAIKAVIDKLSFANIIGSPVTVEASLDDPTIIIAKPPIGGRFNPVANIGIGGMGKAILAVDRYYGAHVAVKVMSPSRKEMWEAELMALKVLSSDKFPRYIAEGINDGKYYFIAMEYIRGITLRRLIDVGRLLKPSEAMIMAIAICHGISAIHGIGLSHNDINPRNIILRRGNFQHPVILDFGISRELGKIQEKATKEYAPPNRKTTPRHPSSDLFSLGATIFEAMTGRRLFSLNRDGDPIEVPFYAFGRIPAPLASILQKMTRLDPSERYQTAEEVVRDISDSLW